VTELPPGVNPETAAFVTTYDAEFEDESEEFKYLGTVSQDVVMADYNHDARNDDEGNQEEQEAVDAADIRKQLQELVQNEKVGSCRPLLYQLIHVYHSNTSSSIPITLSGWTATTLTKTCSMSIRKPSFLLARRRHIGMTSTASA
jgi:hypothetical protein